MRFCFTLISWLLTFALYMNCCLTPSAGDNPMMEFEVARELSRQAVPKLQSIALIIESKYGDPADYACLYRFRVHGEDND